MGDPPYDNGEYTTSSTAIPTESSSSTTSYGPTAPTTSYTTTQSTTPTTIYTTTPNNPENNNWNELYTTSLSQISNAYITPETVQYLEPVRYDLRWKFNDNQFW